MSAVGVTKTRLIDQRIIVYGAGTAGLGIVHQIRDAMVTTDGVSEEEANSKFYLIDKNGLIVKGFGDKIRHGLEPFARADDEWAHVDQTASGKITLLDTVQNVKPTVLIGTSTHGGAFTEEYVPFVVIWGHTRH